MATGVPLPLEALRMETMASGNLSLTLTDRISWEQFPSYAQRVLEVVDGHVGRGRTLPPSGSGA
ncbi:hypothetical protein D3C83_259270 [compost metagenome]